MQSVGGVDFGFPVVAHPTRPDTAYLLPLAGAEYRCTPDVVATAHRALERRVRDEQGALRPHVSLFVGEENVRDCSGAATVLRGGDQVSILAAVSGG